MTLRNRSIGASKQFQIWGSVVAVLVIAVIAAVALVPRGEQLRFTSYLMELMQNSPAAESLANDAIAVDPSFRSYSYHFWLMARHAKETDAIADLEKLIELKPQPNLYLTRAFFHHSKGDYAGAEQDYTRVLAMEPELVSALVNRADARIRLGRNLFAVKDCDEVLRINAKFPTATAEARPAALLNRAEAYVGLAEYRKALKDFEEIQRIAPQFSTGEVAFYRAKAYEGIRQDKLASADRQIAQIQNFNPQHYPDFNIQEFAEEIR